MLTCPKCGVALDVGARFCPHDGTPMDDEPSTAVEVEVRRMTLRGPAVAAPLGVPGPLAPSPVAPNHPTEPDLLQSDQPSKPTEQRDVVPPSSPQGDLVDKVIDNRYHIIERISAGSVGVVYRGEHTQIRRPIAVKVLHEVHNERDDYLGRFEREALAASKMSHPACVSVLDFGTFEGRPYMVMEYVDGRALSDLLREGPLPLPDSVLLTRLILGALRHAHKLGIIHRDIKPANIMLCDPGRTGAQLKVLDFGLAKSLDTEDRAGQHVTLAGTICGTPGYLSPEQAAGLPVDARSDLYSVGAVLFTLVCGRRPFAYGDLAREIRAHLRETPPLIRTLRPEASAELEALVARALEKNPADRYQGADDFIAALAQVPEARGTHAAAPTDLLPVTTVAVAQSTADPALALKARAALPPASDLHQAPTVLHSAPTMLLGGASPRDVAEPAWAAAPGALGPGTTPSAARPAVVPSPSQSLTTVPTTGLGKSLLALLGAVVVILAAVLAWYFTR
jgi:eukaryotic-like serine/threonine-protein kinase